MSTKITTVIGEYKPDDHARDGGACITHPRPDIWFADDTSSDPQVKADKAEAKRICVTLCPVRQKCEEYGLRTRQATGIWGGLTPRARKRLLRKQAA